VAAHCRCFHQRCVATLAVLAQVRSYYFSESAQAALGFRSDPSWLHPACSSRFAVSVNLAQITRAACGCRPAPCSTRLIPATFLFLGGLAPCALPSRLVPSQSKVQPRQKPRQIHPVGVGFYNMTPARSLPTLLGSKSPPYGTFAKALAAIVNKNGEAETRAEHTWSFWVNCPSVSCTSALGRAASGAAPGGRLGEPAGAGKWDFHIHTHIISMSISIPKFCFWCVMYTHIYIYIYIYI
jgi:hypothetical protein